MEDDTILTQDFLGWYMFATEATIAFEHFADNKNLFEIKRYIEQAECIEDSAINHIIEIQGIKFTISIFVDLHCNIANMNDFINVELSEYDEENPNPINNDKPILSEASGYNLQMALSKLMVSCKYDLMKDIINKHKAVNK